MIYIYHHLGLGDHIICNGLVRYYCEIHNQVSVFCKPHNYNNVSYMYRDNKNIVILPIGEDVAVEKYINENKIKNNTIYVGFWLLNGFSNYRFDEGFYVSLNLPFNIRFDKFFFQRDLKKELDIYFNLNPNDEPYIFVHDVDKNKVRKDFKIIKNPTQYSIFDLITLIEKAEEVHVMESSIKNLINSYKFEKPKFFYHQYVRNYPEYNNTQGLNEFEIIF